MTSVAILGIVDLLILDEMELAITVNIEVFPFLSINEIESSMITEKVKTSSSGAIPDFAEL